MPASILDRPTGSGSPTDLRLRITPDLAGRIDEACRRLGKSRSDLVRALLDEGLS